MLRIVSIIIGLIALGSAAGRDIIVEFDKDYLTDPVKECALYGPNSNRRHEGKTVGKDKLAFSGLSTGTYHFVCWQTTIGNWAESPRYDKQIVIDSDQGSSVVIKLPDLKNKTALELHSPIDLRSFFPNFTSVPCRIQRYSDGAPETFGFRWTWLDTENGNLFKGVVHDLVPGRYVLSVPAFLSDDFADDSKRKAPNDDACLIASPFQLSGKPDAADKSKKSTDTEVHIDIREIKPNSKATSREMKK